MNICARIKFMYRGWRYLYRVDPMEIKHMLRYINKGDQVIDIGAHKGGYLYWMKKKVGVKGRVFAYEPQRDLYNYLTDIKHKFDWKNVVTSDKAISNQSGETFLMIPKTDSGSSPEAHVKPHSNNEAKGELSYVVSTVTLDEEMRKSNIKPGFVKIDVEGHELQVLQGAIQMIEQHVPMFLVEIEERHQIGHNDLDKVVDFLMDRGYSCYFFLNNKKLDFSYFDSTKHQRYEQRDDQIRLIHPYVNNFFFAKNN